MTSQAYNYQRAGEILRDPALWPLTVMALGMPEIEARELVKYSPTRAQDHIYNHLQECDLLDVQEA